MDGIGKKKEDSFDKTYNEIRKWIKDNKKIPYDHSKNTVERKLGLWCTDKRKRNKKLSEIK